MSNAWSVYTVEGQGNDAWVVVSTRWTEDGPDVDSKKVVSTLHNTRRAEAEKLANNMQDAYDRLRKVMAEGYAE